MLIEFEAVTKTYRHCRSTRTALAGLSFLAQPGKVLGVLGPNGAGKTTALKILLNLLEPDSGSVRVNNDAGGNRTAHFRESLGYLPEERSLVRGQSVLRQALFLASLKGMPENQARSVLERLVSQFQVQSFMHLPPERLSKGTVQRFCVIATLLNDPKLLVLDEPFSGLDPEGAKTLSDAVKERRNSGATVIISTHRMAEAQKLCDDVLFIGAGRRIFHDSLSLLEAAAGAIMWNLACRDELEILQCAASIHQSAEGYSLILKPDMTVQDLLLELASKKVSFTSLHSGAPGLDQIYLRLAKTRGES